MKVLGLLAIPLLAVAVFVGFMSLNHSNKAEATTTTNFYLEIRAGNTGAGTLLCDSNPDTATTVDCKGASKLNISSLFTVGLGISAPLKVTDYGSVDTKL